MKKVINLTPENFVDVFILCLFWQWEPSSLLYTFTTVDKVLKVLERLGAVTKGHINMVRSRTMGVEHQRLLRRSCDLYYSPSYATSKVRGEAGPTEAAKTMLKSGRNLVIMSSDANFKVNPLRLVRDVHIHLSYNGAAHAQTLADKFAPHFTREQFKEAEMLLNESFRTPASSAAASCRYRGKVRSETGGD